MSDYNLRLTETELNMVLTSLAQLPYAQVNELIQKLSEQITPQLVASAHSTDAPLKEVRS